MRLDLDWLFASALLFVACAPSTEPEIGRSDAPFDEVGRSQAPPSGGAGYDFGIQPSAAEARCAASNGAWKQESGVSSCMVRNQRAGATQLTLVEFCGGSLCRVHSLLALDAPDAKSWLVAFEHLRKQLEKSYGAPDDRQLSLPAECESAFADCVRSGAAAARLRWRWEDGHAVMLLVAAAGDAGAGITVSYASPASARTPEVQRPANR
jgi:hypothetical protein